MTDLQRPLLLEPLTQDPLVSVLVANFNYERYIALTLESMVAQTYSNFEVIVCDDGSEDRSPQVISEFVRRDPRIKLFTQPNGGVASALNRAFDESSGEIICLLDADDTFLPTKLADVVSAFETHSWGVVVHPLLVVDGDGRQVQRKPAFSNFEAGWIGDRVAARGGRWSYMEASAVCLRRSVAQLAFPIPEDSFRTWADAYLCVVGALLSPVGFVDEILAHYRIHGANVSGFDALDVDHGAKAMDGYRRLAGGVSDRMRGLGAPEVSLRPEDNLGYLESDLMLRLFRKDAARGSAAKVYLRYARHVVRDPLYTRSRKALSIFFFGTSLLLPRRFRPPWITAGLTQSRTKEHIRKLLRRLPTTAARNS